MKIVWLSDMDVTGSGYKNLSVSLCSELAKLGHEIKVLGINYNGQEHHFNFSIIPLPNIQLVPPMLHNLGGMWGFDVVITAIDISWHQRIMSMFPDRAWPYWGIFPIEAPPLSKSWAELVAKMNRSFVLSEFGTEETRRMGVDATYLPIGIDTESWRKPSEQERSMLRGSYGYTDEDFVILTVADNQERKNLSRTAQIIRDFRDKYQVSVKWVLVTRIHSDVGWNLDDLSTAMNLKQEMLPLDRGMSFKELWALYALADCFLLTSKAEGVGIPALEAMAVGLPVVATDCTGLAESMRNGGGFPILPEKLEDDFIDPFGSSYRYLASPSSGVRQLHNVYTKQGTEVAKSRGRGYVETLRWERSAQIINTKLEELQNG